MEKLVILVGIPGSGKTTLAQRLVKKGYVWLNADTVREKIFGDAAHQEDARQVYSILYEQIEKALAERLDIVIDNTNLNAKQRKPFLDRAYNAGYKDIQLWLLDVPLDLCLERNRNRSRTVPEDVMVNMHTELHERGIPRKSEGVLVVLRPSKEDPNKLLIFQAEK